MGPSQISGLCFSRGVGLVKIFPLSEAAVNKHLKWGGHLKPKDKTEAELSKAISPEASQGLNRVIFIAITSSTYHLFIPVVLEHTVKTAVGAVAPTASAKDLPTSRKGPVGS